MIFISLKKKKKTQDIHDHINHIYIYIYSPANMILTAFQCGQDHSRSILM